jgi:hypothetical protein
MCGYIEMESAAIFLSINCEKSGRRVPKIYLSSRTVFEILKGKKNILLLSTKTGFCLIGNLPNYLTAVRWTGTGQVHG